MPKRVDATPEWVSEFKEAYVHHLPVMGSDYCPILVKLQHPQRRQRRHFKFEAMWVRNPE